MKLLVCDTSNTNCSAGIFEDGREICYELSFETKTHSETFMPLVHSVMEKAGIRHEDLDGYAVTVGPGSFTGIRIGLAAVKGMALAADKKCIPVSSTEALARSCEVLRERDHDSQGRDIDRSCNRCQEQQGVRDGCRRRLRRSISLQIPVTHFLCVSFGKCGC